MRLLLLETKIIIRLSNFLFRKERLNSSTLIKINNKDLSQLKDQEINNLINSNKAYIQTEVMVTM